MQFKSLAHSNKIAYEVVKETDYSRHRGSVDWGRQYATYGDGMVQHAGLDTIQLEQLGDFLASLATYLMDKDTPESDVEIVERHWPSWFDISTQRILFLASLRPKDEKTVYYSLEENKSSTSESKRHDKRWVTVPTYADGSPGAVYAMAFLADKERDFRDILTQYALYDYIRDTISDHLDTAYEVMRCLIESVRKRESGRRSLESYLSNTRPREPITDEQQAA